MDIFLKVTAGILLTAVISLVLYKQSADISLLLTMLVCCMVVMSAASYLRPVLDFTRKLLQVGHLNDNLLNILFKVVGIGFVSQIAGFICADAGNQSLKKALQITATAVTLCICLPLLEEILSLIETVLGEI